MTGLHGQGSRILPADLVVDATGRGSRAPLWLSELGYAEPPTDRVNIDLSYSSRMFTTPPDLFGDDVPVAIARFPGQLRSSIMQRLEGGRVLVTLAGILDELRRSDKVDPFRFFAAASRILDAPWGIAVGADMATPGVVGPPPPPSPLTGDYVGRLQLAAASDPELAAAFLRVNALIDPPTALLRPEVVARVEAAQAATVA